MPKRKHGKASAEGADTSVDVEMKDTIKISADSEITDSDSDVPQALSSFQAFDSL